MTCKSFSRQTWTLLLAAAVGLGACAGRQGGTGSNSRSDSDPEEQQVLLPGQNRMLPSEDPRNSGQPGQTTIVMPEAVTIGRESPDAKFQPPEVPQGEQRYRVQVMATVRIDKALELRGRLAETIGEEVYIDKEQGIYKVRVGDVEDPEMAQTLRRRLVGLGYDDAFILEFTGR